MKNLSPLVASVALLSITGLLTSCASSQSVSVEEPDPVTVACSAIPESVYDARSEVMRARISSTLGLEYLLEDIRDAKSEIEEPEIDAALEDMQEDVRRILEYADAMSNALVPDLEGWDQSQKNTAFNVEQDVKELELLCGSPDD